MMTDPIADLLTRIRNAHRIRRASVDVPSSRMKRGVAAALKEEGLIADFQEVKEGPRPLLRVYLKYDGKGRQVIRRIERISRPGRRVFSPVAELKPLLGGQMIRILSTPLGILSERKCRENKVGGEVLCRVF